MVNELLIYGVMLDLLTVTCVQLVVMQIALQKLLSQDL